MEMARHGTGGPRGTLNFAEIYRGYFDFVWSSTRRLGVALESLDDVVQEIFIVIHARLHTLERSDALRSWIYGIVRRTVSTYHRTRRAKEEPPVTGMAEDEIYPSRPLTPSELAEQSDQVKLLWALLGELDAPKREVFILSEIEQMTVPEIAEAIEVPVNTVYSRLRASKIAFEEALSRHNARKPVRWGLRCRT